LPGLGDKCLHQDHHPHAKRRTQQHQLASFSIGEAAPQRRNGGRDDKGNAEGQTRPEAKRIAAVDAELFNIERQKRNDLTDGQAGKKTAEPDRDKIYFPGFNCGRHEQRGGYRRSQQSSNASLSLSDKTWHPGKNTLLRCPSSFSSFYINH